MHKTGKRRWLWFITLYLAGVVALTAVAALLKAAIGLL